VTKIEEISLNPKEEERAIMKEREEK